MIGVYLMLKKLEISCILNELFKDDENIDRRVLQGLVSAENH